MHEMPTDDRRRTILEAAFRTFVTYGFKRTTMADIAKAAKLSRPALYLVFSNKTEIYRAKYFDLLEEARRDVRKAFEAHEDFPAGLKAAVDAAIVQPYRTITGTPHGLELFDMKQEVGDDLAEAWFAMFESEVETAFKAHARMGRIDPAAAGINAKGFARLLVTSVEGIKMRMKDIDTAAEEFDRLVDFFCRSLWRKVA